jgi:hypothetical protein
MFIGYGGYFKESVFSYSFPRVFKEKKYTLINCLELLTISIAMKIWGKQFGGKNSLK